MVIVVGLLQSDFDTQVIDDSRMGTRQRGDHPRCQADRAGSAKHDGAGVFQFAPMFFPQLLFDACHQSCRCGECTRRVSQHRNHERGNHGLLGRQ